MPTLRPPSRRTRLRYLQDSRPIVLGPRSASIGKQASRCLYRSVRVSRIGCCAFVPAAAAHRWISAVTFIGTSELKPPIRSLTLTPCRGVSHARSRRPPAATGAGASSRRSGNHPRTRPIRRAFCEVWGASMMMQVGSIPAMIGGSGRKSCSFVKRCAPPPGWARRARNRSASIRETRKRGRPRHLRRFWWSAERGSSDGGLSRSWLNGERQFGS